MGISTGIRAAIMNEYHVISLCKCSHWLRHEAGEFAEGAWASGLSYEQTRAGWVERIEKEIRQKWPTISNEEMGWLINEFF
jgi:hypothetical protein